MLKTTLLTASYTLAISTFAFSMLPLPAQALTMKECSAKYQAAKETGSLGNISWADFRKTQCSANTNSQSNSTHKNTPVTKAAKALTSKQCSEKYQAAKEAGLAADIKWNDFRKMECAAGADPVALTTDGTKEPPAPTIAAPRGVSFPRAVSSKYASESPGRARMRTCLEHYHNEKAKNALGGLKWIQKGGGYYSLCNQRLKASS